MAICVAILDSNRIFFDTWHAAQVLRPGEGKAQSLGQQLLEVVQSLTVGAHLARRQIQPTSSALAHAQSHMH